MGGLEGRIGLPALQPVPCLSGSWVCREGHGRLVYQIYLGTWMLDDCRVAFWGHGDIVA